jgi:fatty-acyl-CoA synthase
MAYEDENGYFHIVDRKKDMIISGGFNIYPQELEQVLTKHAAVSAAAVIGVPDPKWGESVKAFVVVKSGHTVDSAELISLAREKKGAVMAPKTVEFVTQLPLTELGKIDKKALRAPYWQNLKKGIN